MIRRSAVVRRGERSVATKPVDFRKGAEGLAALVRKEMRVDPFGGAIFVIRA